MNTLINLTNHGDEFDLYDEFHQGHERNQGYQFNKAKFIFIMMKELIYVMLAKSVPYLNKILNLTR